MTMVLFENNFINLVGITFTALILSELLNIALEIHTWHWLMVAAELFSLLAYLLSIVILRTYFDMAFREKLIVRDRSAIDGERGYRDLVTRLREG
jgi:phospholipid-translocating ATPase